MLLARIQERPEPPAKEWVATFSTYSTDLPEGTATFEAELAIDYPGRRRARAAGAASQDAARLLPVSHGRQASGPPVAASVW